ncbi:hypothetical protein AUJ95_03515 [Candidatus Desantisbacteria bacterium CG2_30_40_21]|uniref:Uncharacterized protein n=5 Tax=unclassified Candidatus Desantisiibacteriota TaxID=3106372 RepID=A0A2M7JBT7_9BACT|nr:MAG: hypothetical protein AUJ95_03515 [Candidatus Desantisbacteria bacterium CG2_30_40_21]PIP41069.1 MAG: hypothetical protein COX18_04545 [Candidatus Desantisbacteria bacterium CG23_combo_of_CG06-09_8_20_14_all_40_23]PIX16837.1 MAG: hypothetical protein COZ71_06515 [Candidatus Desantisbacteria bacterium CG_4_8_14_3_um_filter_40_12]PIY19195.1 MAG: hypothetical protein COZ13_06575 [Candidatus Desantisbacteria bacterium CG_4_10_14_3_um_filter_40_18]PJB30277.1 MAG: hypothetical protein CO110_01
MSVVKNMTFESKLLPDGHLYCPEDLAYKQNINFKVIVTFKKPEIEASEYEIELSNIKDISEDFLSQEELNYYLNLEPL